MRFTKGFVLAVAVVVLSFLLSDLSTFAARPNASGPHKPVPATDVTLVRKISLKGGPAHAGGKRMANAATGILESTCEGDKYAIVVGISNYPGTHNDLDYADDDALLMASILQSAYGFTQVTTLIDADATHDEILDAVGALWSVGPDDEVVFFFSGHGMNGIADDGDAQKWDQAIVACPDYDRSHPETASLPYTPIWDGELKRAFASVPAGRILFIFDSCNAGGMDDLAGPGRVLLMACGERGYSWEGDEWAYGDNEGDGEFTYYLAQGILEAKANLHDYDNDGVPAAYQVTAEEAYDYAKANCDQDRPQIADDFEGDLLP